jgi:hypothetical protein
LAHLSDPEEQELVKQEISTRYYQHYLNIINKPEDQPQPEAPPAPEEETPPDTAEAAGKEEPHPGTAPAPGEKPGEPAATRLEEDLASIPEVTPITLTMPVLPEEAAKTEEKKAPEQPAKRKFCFIATAAYGSPLAREVVLLQDFRDHCLTRHALGEQFIRAYYRVSPALARQISKNNLLKLLTRFLLTPVIFLIKKISGQ